MDPAFVERHWADLPHLAGMRARGSFTRLATTTPPQSPTAWSTFITGLDPAEHGIFDFVHRDPTTMQPFLSMSGTTEARFRIPLGPWQLPLSRSQVVSLRKGKAFWQTLEEHGIPATIVHMPVNYPPVESGEGLAGMGTPDLRGTQGTFSYYTDDPGDKPRAVSGGAISRAEVIDGHAVLRLNGPPNSLRRDHRASSAQLIVDVDPAQPFARLAIGDSIAIVREGEWSDWLIADFPLYAASGFRARNGSRIREAAPSALRGLRVARQRRSRIGRSADFDSPFFQPRDLSPNRPFLHAGDSRRHIGNAAGSIRSAGVFVAKPSCSGRRAETSRLLARSFPRRPALLLLLFRRSEFAHALGPARCGIAERLSRRGCCHRRSASAKTVGRSHGHVGSRLRLVRSIGGLEQLALS